MSLVYRFHRPGRPLATVVPTRTSSPTLALSSLGSKGREEHGHSRKEICWPTTRRVYWARVESGSASPLCPSSLPSPRRLYASWTSPKSFATLSFAMTAFSTRISCSDLTTMARGESSMLDRFAAEADPASQGRPKARARLAILVSHLQRDRNWLPLHHLPLRRTPPVPLPITEPQDLRHSLLPSPFSHPSPHPRVALNPPLAPPWRLSALQQCGSRFARASDGGARRWLPRSANRARHPRHWGIGTRLPRTDDQTALRADEGRDGGRDGADLWSGGSGRRSWPHDGL